MMEMFSEFFQFDFMRRAFGAILVISPLLGILGTMIVHKRMAYFSDALGHSALTGIAIGVVMGVQDTSISMLLFAVVFALLLNQISRRALAATDTVISVFASCSTAIGLAILSMGGNFSRYSAILVGDILSITTREIFYLILIFAGTLVFWCVAVNLLNAVSVHPALARSRHLNVRLAEDVFAVVIALVVTLSIKWVGILLINALLILPGGLLAEHFGKYAGVPSLLCDFLGIFGNGGSVCLLLYQCGNRPHDCDRGLRHLLCHISLREEPVAKSAVGKQQKK